MKTWVENYLTEHERVVRSIPRDAVADAIELLRQARQDGRTIFTCGNGGSAANASHFAVDLGKGASLNRPTRFKILSLNDNTPYVTALANDVSYEDVFVEQLINFAMPGDILLCMSVSGNSPNVVKALAWAADHEMVTIGLGSRRGGRLAELAEHKILIDDDHFGRVEDAHMHICHMLCYAFMENE
jgi:D-sedoheptulose 7-phosphate isomerase